MSIHMNQSAVRRSIMKETEFCPVSGVFWLGLRLVGPCGDRWLALGARQRDSHRLDGKHISTNASANYSNTQRFRESRNAQGSTFARQFPIFPSQWPAKNGSTP